MVDFQGRLFFKVRCLSVLLMALFLLIAGHIQLGGSLSIFDCTTHSIHWYALCPTVVWHPDKSNFNGYFSVRSLRSLFILET